MTIAITDGAYAPPKNTTAFARMLVARWAARQISQAEFCRRVGMPAGWVQQIRNGTKTMPLERVDLFAQVLGMGDRERSLLRDLAALTHVRDERMRARFETLALRDNAAHGIAAGVAS